MKLFSLITVSLLVFCSFASLEARHSHKKVTHKSRSSSSHFSFNLGIQPLVSLFGLNYSTAPVREEVVTTTYVPAPVVVEQHVYPAYPVSYYREEVVVRRPYTERVYVYPQRRYY